MGAVDVLWDGDGVPPERTWDLRMEKYYGIEKEMGYSKMWTDTHL